MTLPIACLKTQVDVFICQLKSLIVSFVTDFTSQVFTGLHIHAVQHSHSFSATFTFMQCNVHIHVVQHSHSCSALFTFMQCNIKIHAVQNSRCYNYSFRVLTFKGSTKAI